MNFGFTDDQEQLRQATRRFLDERCPLTEVRRIMESDAGFDEGLWREIAELGWLGMIIPEAYGGSGLSWVDWIVVLEECGRSLFPSPMISTILAASAIDSFGSDQQKKKWLPGIADGSIKGSLALFEQDADPLEPSALGLRGRPDGDAFVLSGRKHFVGDPQAADFFVVSFRGTDDDISLAIVEAGDGVRGTSFPMIDATKRMGNLDLVDVRVEPEQMLGTDHRSDHGTNHGGHEAFAELVDRGAIAVTAEAGGSVDQAIRITVRYANERTQFGHPIGHFQGVKHPLAEMYVDCESFKSLLYYATWALENRPEIARRYTSLAKAYADETFIRAGTDLVTLHGATGFTVEYDIQLYFKRSKWFRPVFGDAAAHYERALALHELDIAQA